MTAKTPEALADAKAIARREAFARRKVAKSFERDRLAADRLAGELHQMSQRVIAGYMPIRTEVDPLPVMSDLCSTNRVCVPVILGADQPLVFRQWTPDAMMEPGAFGARIPKDGAELEPDIIIVPLVAFTSSGDRLGYGGGFYDRTLELLRKKKNVRAIGFAFEAQLAEALPQEPTDQTLDMIVTDVCTRDLG